MTASPMRKIAPGIKVAAQMSPEPSAEDLQFVRQMGVEYVVLWTDGKKAGYDYYRCRGDVRRKRRQDMYQVVRNPRRKPWACKGTEANRAERD